AWELNLPRNVLTVDYDATDQFLVAIDHRLARRSITGCREALNGYQKGRCFYCFGTIVLNPQSDLCPDIDHFFPHALKAHGFYQALDGVWNLVLACHDCNRGPKGKFHKLPHSELLQRLHTRNNFLIESHHPLRETLIVQTGNSEPARRQYLQDSFRRAKELLIHEWKPESKFEPVF
ncbi:MAG: HNH endonuclease, partial [Planctomycetota bacterium]